ncbi:hypothetical protein T484DRAFT_2025205 [Baffinella frigidus]|nr:hypothetical protein T484DRAFT_2025205 [Cryptophyta sp. CCMP2293]
MAPQAADPAAAARPAGVPPAGVKLRGSKVKKGALPPVSLEPPVGTRDFYPEQLRARAWLFERFRAVSSSFGFQEYDSPVLEHEALYTRKAGEEITGQMYNFVDKGGYNVTLRPEMTPSLARMVLAREKELVMPLKWCSLPQCFRFENVQRGRKREHYQWNLDIVGVQVVTAEAELIAALVALFRSLGLGPADVGIKINSRRVLGALLGTLGVPEGLLAPVCIALDKVDRLECGRHESPKCLDLRKSIAGRRSCPLMYYNGMYRPLQSVDDIAVNLRPHRAPCDAL